MQDPFLIEYERLRVDILAWFRARADPETGLIPEPYAEARAALAIDLNRPAEAISLIFDTLLSGEWVFESVYGGYMLADDPRPRPRRPVDPRTAARRRFANCSGRRKLRARIDAGLESCKTCGSTEKLHVDHILALANGGTNDEDNLQVLCATCNIRKGARVVA